MADLEISDLKFEIAHEVYSLAQQLRIQSGICAVGGGMGKRTRLPVLLG
jgi:hypothetical protein